MRGRRALPAGRLDTQNGQLIVALVLSDRFACIVVSNMLKRTPALLVACVALALSQVPGHAEERIDYEINARIRKEGRDNSQIMRTVHVLTDVYGPRLTGSPNHKAAAEWAIKRMTEWGFENAHLEPWDFGHPGWANERASGFIVSPVKDSLVLEVLAWTPGTKGAVTAKAFQIAPPQCPPPAARGEAPRARRGGPRRRAEVSDAGGADEIFRRHPRGCERKDRAGGASHRRAGLVHASYAAA